MTSSVKSLPLESLLSKGAHAAERVPAEPHFRKRNEPSIGDMAFLYGAVYDSYLAAEKNRREFWSSDRSGVLSFVRIGRHVKVGGGLLAPPEARSQLLGEFLALCRREKWTASFFTITPADVELFRFHGCEVAKWGEDPLVDLADWNCRGKDFEWLRRQENYCRRHGVLCIEWDPRSASTAERRATFAEIEAVSQEWLEAKPQARPLDFFNGEPNPKSFAGRRIFLARADEGRGRLEAFVVASPFDAGERWGLDIYRHRDDAVRGAVPFTMLGAIRALQADGAQAVSLCMVAALGCAAATSPTLLNRLLSWGGRCLSPLFDLAGMYHYKSRFRPRFEPRYVCMWPRASLMNSMTTFYLTGITNFSIRKLLVRAWRQRFNRQRRTLASYEYEPAAMKRSPRNPSVPVATSVPVA